MFVNFASLKNFRHKKFYFKCPGSSRTILHRNREEVAIYCGDVRSLSAATLPKYCKCVRLLNKSQIQQFHILRRILSTNRPLFKQSQGSTNDTSNPNDKGFIKDLALTTAAIFVILLILRKNNSFTPPYISWEEFKREILAKGEVKNLVIYTREKAVRVELQEGAVIKNIKTRPVFLTPFSPGFFALEVADVRKFEERLREAEEDLGISATNRVPISYVHSRETGIWPLLLVLAAIWFILRSSKFSFKGKGYTDLIFPLRPRYTLIDPLMGHTTRVKFSDVAGLKEAKTEIMDFVDYLKRPEIYRSLGARVPKGALLLGPPGCGKTLLAKAVATEANVPFISMNGSEFMELIGGLGAARVRGLFKIAKIRSPCIVYIDEIDAIGKKRVSFGDAGGEAEQTLNQLLVEMDGVVSNEGVLLLASTNRADVLDKALLRPGRFDRRILIDLPTFQERQEIFEHHLKSVHLEEKPETYSKRMAHLTAGFSGADIANVCNEAALHAARLKKQIVQGDDLEYAVERAVGGTEKRTSCRTPEEKKLFAYYEAGRALVGWLSKYGEALIKITIVARTESPSGWTHFPPVDKSLYSEDDLRGKMCMGLGGRVAITVLFNRVTTAGEKDLKKVTNLAYAQVRRFGMNKNVGLMSFDNSETDEVLRKPYSKVLGNLFDHEVRKLVADTYKEAEKIILENKDKLIKLAEELLVKETLSYDDVVKLIGPPAFEGKTLIEPLEFVKSLDQAVGTENTT